MSPDAYDGAPRAETGESPPAPVPGESTTRRILRRTGEILALPLIALIRVYQIVISPLTPPTCRYYPSCSAYAVTALRRFGPVKGTWLAVRRVGRCHPWAPGGVDHVPPKVPPPVAGPPVASAPSTARATGAAPQNPPTDFRSHRATSRPMDKGLS